MTEITCNRCGQDCAVEEAKPNKPVAWCDECGDYADTQRDIRTDWIAAQVEYAMNHYEGLDPDEYGGAA